MGGKPATPQLDELHILSEPRGSWSGHQLPTYFKLRLVYLLLDRLTTARAITFGIQASYIAVLYALRDGGARTSTELRQWSLVGISNMTSIIDRMTRDGLAERFNDPADRRRKPVRLTARGLEVARAIIPEHIEWIISMFDVLNKEESDELVRLLGILWKELARRADESGVHTTIPGT